MDSIMNSEACVRDLFALPSEPVVLSLSSMSMGQSYDDDRRPDDLVLRERPPFVSPAR